MQIAAKLSLFMQIFCVKLTLCDIVAKTFYYLYENPWII